MINPFILSTTVNSDLVYMGLDKLLNGRVFFTCATRLHGAVQILLQIAVLFVHQRLARFRGSSVNKRRICASFCPFKNFFGPV